MEECLGLSQTDSVLVGCPFLCQSSQLRVVGLRFFGSAESHGMDDEKKKLPLFFDRIVFDAHLQKQVQFPFKQTP